MDYRPLGAPLGYALALLENVRLGRVSVTKQKFYNIDNWCQCYNFFPLLLMTRPKKLEFLYLAITSSLTFAGAYPRRMHLKGAPIGLALALPSNSKT